DGGLHSCLIPARTYAFAVAICRKRFDGCHRNGGLNLAQTLSSPLSGLHSPCQLFNIVGLCRHVQPTLVDRPMAPRSLIETKPRHRIDGFRPFLRIAVAEKW